MKKLITFLLLITATFCYGQSFISPTGNDVIGNGTQALPWKTLFKATSTVTAGTIRVLAGTYTETQASNLKTGVSIEGDGAATTIIKSAMTGDWSTLLELQSADGTNGNQSISKLTLDGQYVSETSFKTWVAIWITGRSNVAVHDCIIKNFKQTAVIFSGINENNPGTDAGKLHAIGNAFYNNTVTNSAAMYNGTGQGALMIGFQKDMLIYDNNISTTQRPNFKNGWPIKYWNQGWLKGVKIYNNTLTKKPYAGTYPGENSDWDFAIELFSIEGLEIYNNTIQGAIDLNYNYKGTYPYSVWIHNNTLNHPVFNSKVEGAIILEFRTESALIEDNIINNKSYGITFNTRGPTNKGGDRNNYVGGNTPGGYSYLVNNIIRNNLFTNIYEGQGIGNSFAIGVISEGTDDPQINNMQIYNNTIVGKPGNGMRIGLDFTSQPNGNCQNLLIQSNIVNGSKSSWLQGSNTRTNINGATVTHNNAWQNATNTPYWPGGNPVNYTYSNNLSVNPLFVSATDYHLQSTSPLIGAGFNGMNIGCYGSAAPPPVPCTYTYGPWEECINGVQVRQLLSTSPAGCTGTPVVIQTCTMPPCTYSYSEWGPCINGIQTRTAVALPSGCIPGNPILTQACTAPPVNDTIPCTVILHGTNLTRTTVTYIVKRTDGNYYDSKGIKRIVYLYKRLDTKWMYKGADGLFYQLF